MINKKFIFWAITLLFLSSCMPEKKADTSKTGTVNSEKIESLKIEYTYINFVNNRLVLEKHNLYESDTNKVRKGGYKFKTVKRNILYNHSKLENSTVKRSDLKLLLTLNHLDSAYLTTNICPMKYYDDFYILIKSPNKDYEPPYGNRLYYFDTLNVSLTELKYNQILKEPVEYRPGSIIMYNHSYFAEYNFFISKAEMEFKIGESIKGKN